MISWGSRWFSVCAGLVALGLLLLTRPLQAVPTGNGVDCACSKTGNYVRPAPPVDIAIVGSTPTTSPGGKYALVASLQNGSARVRVTNTLTSTVVLSDLPGVSWGFSPDGERFVIYLRIA